MDKRVKKLWVDALKSGEYEQGHDRLLIPGDKYDKFCCLGVLTDLYVRETKDSSVWTKNNYLLDELVVRWAGLDSDDPKIGKSFACIYNDEEKLSFKKIANLIEKNL